MFYNMIFEWRWKMAKAKILSNLMAHDQLSHFIDVKRKRIYFFPRVEV